jgi:hypothetical protein
MCLKIGSKVSWTSVINNFTIQKKGIIVCIVKPGEDLTLKIEELKKEYKFFPIFNPGVREEESYGILVEGKNKKHKLYWVEGKDLKKYNIFLGI